MRSEIDDAGFGGCPKIRISDLSSSPLRQHHNNEPADDEVFVDSDDKENNDFGISPPSPSPVWDRGFCVDSPTRKAIQKDASQLPPSVRKLGQGG